MPIVVNATLIVRSAAFEENGFIPSRYTCLGSNINPELTIKDIPKEAKSLALVMNDPDATGGFDHWVMWNIPVNGKIEENSAPGVQGKNSENEK